MLTKEEAEAAGKAVLARMKGKGWKLCLWENLGWNWCLELGALSIHPSRTGYFTLLNDKEHDGHAGSHVWLYPGCMRDPNRLVRAQIKLARKRVNQLDSIVKRLESALKG